MAGPKNILASKLSDAAARLEDGAALPLLLAAAFAVLNAWLPYRAGAADIRFTYLPGGGALRAGLPEAAVGRMMPLFSVSFSALLGAGLAPGALLAGLGFAVYLLVFCAGCLLGGWRAGVAAMTLSGLFSAAGRWKFDDEQAFYAFFLLLVLCLLVVLRFRV